MSRGSLFIFQQRSFSRNLYRDYIACFLAQDLNTLFYPQRDQSNKSSNDRSVTRTADTNYQDRVPRIIVIVVVIVVGRILRLKNPFAHGHTFFSRIKDRIMLRRSFCHLSSVFFYFFLIFLSPSLSFENTRTRIRRYYSMEKMCKISNPIIPLFNIRTILKFQKDQASERNF